MDEAELHSGLAVTQMFLLMQQSQTVEFLQEQDERFAVLLLMLTL